MTANEIKNSRFYQRVEFLADYRGYEVSKCFYSERLGAYQVSLYPINRYAPEISTIGSWVEDARDMEFEMQTTAFGALHGNDLDDYIECVTHGWHLVKELNELDWEDCPVLDADSHWK